MFLRLTDFAVIWKYVVFVNHKFIGCAQLRELVYIKRQINVIRMNTKSLKKFSIKVIKFSLHYKIRGELAQIVHLMKKVNQCNI